MLAGALACPTDSPDAIDTAVQEAFGNFAEPGALHAGTTLCRSTRSASAPRRSLEGPDGVAFRATKGAPQVIIAMGLPEGEGRERAKAQVEELAEKGYRTLGVARSR